jgi:hypothetical protein
VNQSQSLVRLAHPAAQFGLVTEQQDVNIGIAAEKVDHGGNRRGRTQVAAHRIDGDDGRHEGSARALRGRAALSPWTG